MTSPGVRKARVVLRSLGRINKRYKEQQKARASLQKLLDAVNERPTAANLVRLNKAVEDAIKKEKAIAGSTLSESTKVIQLRKALATLSENYTRLQEQLENNTPKTTLTKAQRKKELKKRLLLLEKSLGNSNNKKIREKIASLKKQI